MKNSRKDSRQKHRSASVSTPSHARGGGKPVSKSGGPAFVQIPKDWRPVIGFHAIREAMRVHGKHIKEAWFKQGFESTQELKDLAKELKSMGREVQEKPAALLDRLYPSHQGAALFLSITPSINWSKLEESTHSTVLVLDGLEDPHNLGAILRTSWLMEVDGVLVPEDRAAGLTATVHKVACGGVEHVPVEKVTNFSNPIEKLKKDGYWVFGLSHLGKKTLFDLQIPEKVVWCIGSEDKGLRVTTERMCDELIQIPQVSAAASYNASVATAIALTETLRTRTRDHKTGKAKKD